jgi:hypothetical protein
LEYISFEKRLLDYNLDYIIWVENKEGSPGFSKKKEGSPEDTIALPAVPCPTLPCHATTE